MKDKLRRDEVSKKLKKYNQEVNGMYYKHRATYILIDGIVEFIKNILKKEKKND
jgi:hypothetical protein